MCYHVRAAGRRVLLPDADGYTTEPAKRKMQVLSLLKKKKYFKFNFCFWILCFWLVFESQWPPELLPPPLRFLWKLRAPLRTDAVTDLLVARLLRLESVVDRLEGEIEVGEIVQPVCPPRSDVIKPCSGHSCVEEKSSQSAGATDRALPPVRPWNSDSPRCWGKWKKKR